MKPANRITTSQLIEKWGANTGQIPLQAKRNYEALINLIYKHLKEGKKINLSGFGTFSIKKLRGRIGVNPRNPAQKITIPPTAHIKFISGEQAKKQVNG